MNTPSSRWAAAGEPDPHGKHYSGDLSLTAGGHLSCAEIAKRVLCGGVFSIGEILLIKDRIRWLSRKVSDTHLVRSERADMPYGELTDDELANAVFMEETVPLKTAAVKRMLWLESKL